MRHLIVLTATGRHGFGHFALLVLLASGLGLSAKVRLGVELTTSANHLLTAVRVDRAGSHVLSAHSGRVQAMLRFTVRHGELAIEFDVTLLAQLILALLASDAGEIDL